MSYTVIALRIYKNMTLVNENIQEIRLNAWFLIDIETEGNMVGVYFQFALIKGLD